MSAFDTVLGQMRTISAHVSGDALRGSVLTVLTDGVEVFKPDHILLALRTPCSRRGAWPRRVAAISR